MATPVIPSTNVGIYNHFREATDCNETTNLSLKSIASGGVGGNSIQNTFGAQGGPAFQFDGGIGEYELALEDPPYAMSSFFGGYYL